MRQHRSLPDFAFFCFAITSRGHRWYYAGHLLAASAMPQAVEMPLSQKTSGTYLHQESYVASGCPVKATELAQLAEFFNGKKSSSSSAA